jgi:hypothetical protein
LGNQTYKKRQKELARQQKQRDKAARRQQRKAEKRKGGPPLEGQGPVAGVIRPGFRAGWNSSDTSHPMTELF